ncbi:39S ribosomal protein L16, mitochondrial [Coemansia sp. RSA 1933]|nr:39S ribosomal protein L16, mitochondrial [Coemansia sp. RSA 1933]
MWATRIAKTLLTQPRLGSYVSVLNRGPVGTTMATIGSTVASQARSLSTLQPRRRKYKKAQKGRVAVRTGGSTKGNYIAFGDYGIRVKEGIRLPATTISAIHKMLRRKLKSIKDLSIWLRVFPDIPVTTKGTEVRMGKGKGAFDFWACRVPKGKILFELKGTGLNAEIAKESMRQAGFKLGVASEFVIANEKTRQPSKTDLPPTTIPFQHAK